MILGNDSYCFFYRDLKIASWIARWKGSVSALTGPPPDHQPQPARVYRVTALWPSTSVPIMTQ